MTALQSGGVAVVTGAASGIGRSLARAFAARGLRLVLGVHRPEQCVEIVRDPQLQDVETLPFAVNVADADAVNALMTATMERFGSVDIVCNNAGVGVSNVPVWEASTADWDAAIGVNLLGVRHGIRAFVPHLVAQGHGHVVNTSSMAGLTVFAGNGAYSASKHAVVAMSETLRLDLDAIGSKVGVTVVCPGPVDTPQLARGRQTLLAHLAGLGEQLDLSATTVSATVPVHPDFVAELALDAIENDQLYLFPNPNSSERVRERTKRVIEGAGFDWTDWIAAAR